MVQAYTTMSGDPTTRDAVSNFVFTPACDALLFNLGYTVNGNSVTIAAATTPAG